MRLPSSVSCDASRWAGCARPKTSLMWLRFYAPMRQDLSPVKASMSAAAWWFDRLETVSQIYLMAEFRLYCRGKLIGVRHQRGQLPALCVRQGAPKSGHAGQPNAMRHLPECFAFRVARHHVLLFEKLRRIREHPFRDQGGGLPWSTVAEHAVLFVFPHRGQHGVVIEGKRILLIRRIDRKSV